MAHIEHDVREFGTWLADHHPQVGSCADLERHHIEHVKAWLATKHGLRTGKPLNRISIKHRLINLPCFFDRITEWGYPHPPQRPLVFAGDLPIVTAPAVLREELEGLADSPLLQQWAGFRPGPVTTPIAATKHALRALACRWLDLHREVQLHDVELDRLTQE